MSYGSMGMTFGYDFLWAVYVFLMIQSSDFWFYIATHLRKIYAQINVLLS